MADLMKHKAEDYLLDVWFKCNSSADILNSEFVDGFIKAVGCKYKQTTIGACKCDYASRSLKRLYDMGLLNRGTINIDPSLSGMGFPKWVYSYSIKQN